MNDKTGGIAAIAGTIIGIYLMINVWAILGMIVYMITFGACLHKLKGNVAYEETFNIMAFVKQISKETFWQEGIYTIVVAILPIAVCIFLYSWIVLDSVRSVEFWSKMFM